MVIALLLIVHISRIREKATELSQQNLSKECEKTIKKKNKTKSKSPFTTKKNRVFYGTDVEDSGRTISKASTFFGLTAPLLLLRSSPSLSLPPTLNHPLFFLSPAPTTLYNVRNMLGPKLLVSLLYLTWPYSLRHEVDASRPFTPLNGRRGSGKNMRFFRPPTATEDLMVSTTYGVQEPTIVCHFSKA
jgi:hypothetical protein